MNTEHNEDTPKGRPASRNTASGHSPVPPSHADERRTRPSVAGSRRVHGVGRTAAPAAHSGKPSPSSNPSATGQIRRPSVNADAFRNVPRHDDHSNEREPRMGQNAYPATDDPHASPTHFEKPQQNFTPLWDEDPLPNPRLTRRIFVIGGVAAAAAVAFFGFGALRKLMPISITVNGQKVDLSGAKTLQNAYEKSGLSMTPGNLIDVEGQVITEGGGRPYTATINGQDAFDGETALADGDTLAFADGTDVEEPSTTEERTVEPNPVESGYGPIHIVGTPGASGAAIVKIGQTSGKEVAEVTQAAEDRVYLRAYPDTGGDKAIALTFDDGPWEDSTAEILDILRDNGAVATFFTVGERIAGQGVELVKREHDEGHQVCTHSWDHAAGSGQGVNMGFMSVDEQRAEIEKGHQAISDATGDEASRVFRSPGGNFPIEVWRNVEDLVDAEIGWDIDTLDWQRPGAAVVAGRIKAATPGDIILMHDGGGDRSQTAEALRDALPYLKEQGFRFVTMDEMLQFPRKEG